MKENLIYKFGGASVKDASSVRNLVNIIKNTGIKSKLVIVISAMGKMTNAFELLVDKSTKSINYDVELDKIYEYHISIIKELFNEFGPKVDDFDEHFSLLKAVLANANKMNHDFAYDQIVSFGEVFSTQIISDFLNQEGVINQWIDARRCIHTDSNWRNANVNFDWTVIRCGKYIYPIIEEKLVVTQGFIGSDADGNTTTLGREGSDYSGAIFAFCLEAKSLTIWKDVPGILNADPKKITAPIKYDQLSYEEVIEMSYYGATVIHPKTIKPLANKNIPLYVKSFIEPDKNGTEIGALHHSKIAPAIIIKEKQVLISFRKKDLSFIDENNISEIVEILSQLNFKINLIQKSALNLSVATDLIDTRIDSLLSKTQNEYNTHYNSDLQLITIKNYKTLEIPKEIDYKTILLEQITRKNIQYLVR